MNGTSIPLEALCALVDKTLREGPEPPEESLDWQEAYAYTLGVQAYVWGFPWLYLARLRWLWTTPAGHALAKKAGMNIPYAPINRFFNSPVLASPATQTGGSPNVDTLYSTAWLDLSGGPIVLSVPAVPDRYYCMEMACIDSDNFAYVGTRSTGTAPGNYLIAGQEWNGRVPSDVMDILPRSRTPTVLVLGRTGVNNRSQADLDAAHAVQAGYQLRPLATYPATRYTIAFTKNGFPPYDASMHGFWSLTLYDTTYNLVPGSTAYSVNSNDPEYQTRDSEGGMTILIQNQQPESLQPGQYWLESPTAEFYLFLRVYIPGPEISNTQTWVPPSVEKSGG